MSATDFKAGLEDVIAADSSICFIDGLQGRLLYRGYDIADLAEHSKFAEVAYLLWHGRLPTATEYDEFLKKFRGSIELPDPTVQILRLLPKNALPMEALRTAISSLGHWDPDSGDNTPEASPRKAVRLTARLGVIITAHERLRRDEEPIKPIPGRSVAFNFLYTLKGTEPDPLLEQALDVALILHADHEFNASTFAGRVCAATLSDMYSCVTAAVGTLKGPLHGGANEQVMRMLREIGDPAKAEAYIQSKLAGKVKVPGFGHRVYRTEDPRATVLRRFSESLGRKIGDARWFEISQEVERVVRANTKVYPNVDFYSASVYHSMGIPDELFTPIFALSRVVGWTAHIMEQWSNNRLIRPRAEYRGPEAQRYVPIEER